MAWGDDHRCGAVAVTLWSREVVGHEPVVVYFSTMLF